jgi:hypothetical protein
MLDDLAVGDAEEVDVIRGKRPAGRWRAWSTCSTKRPA